MVVGRMVMMTCLSLTSWMPTSRWVVFSISVCTPATCVCVSSTYSGSTWYTCTENMLGSLAGEDDADLIAS